MKRSDLSFQQIFNQLLAGQKLVMYFANDTDAETFRVRMHHHKSAQEKIVSGLGFSIEDEKTVLSFRKQKPPEAEGSEVVAYISFATQSPLKKYPVIILEPSDIQQAVRLREDAEVPADLAQAQG